MQDQKQSQALSIRLWLALLSTQEMLCNYLGIRLGLYDALADGVAVTPPQLAARAAIAPRYAREWLEQQAVSGIVRVEHDSDDGEARRYALPAGHREVLTDSDSAFSRVAGILPLGAVAYVLPQLLQAYRSGGGIPDRAFGPDWRHGHGGGNRALFTHLLPGWIRSNLSDIHGRLVAGGRVADVACGAGWAAIVLAHAYPNVKVDGFEIDFDLVGDATGHAAQAGVSDRVNFCQRDCSQPYAGQQYDMVCLFDTLHELPGPVEVLRACGAMCVPGGAVLVMDAFVAEKFHAPANEVERFQYTTSVLHCLPASLISKPSAATGTVMRPDIVRQYARDAGFSSVEIVAVNDRFHRLYRLRP